MSEETTMTDVEPTASAAPCPAWSREEPHPAHDWDAPVDGASRCPGWPPLDLPGDPYDLIPPDKRAKLNEDLAEMARVRHQAYVAAAHMPVGGTVPASPLLDDKVADAIFEALVPVLGGWAPLARLEDAATDVAAALEPLIAALVAERERAAYERGHRDGVEDAL